MPFTPAHPAIVLPFLRWRYVSATGLIVGTVSPDFEYFFKMGVDDDHGHTLAGIFYFDLPVTLFLAFVFHQLVKTNLVDNLPYFFQKRLSLLRQFDFVNYFKKHWKVFLLSAIIGAFLHILWDSFTHGAGFFVQRISWLRMGRFPYAGVRYPMWYALQYICTFAGLLVVMSYVVAMKPDHSSVRVTPSAYYWVIIIAVIVMVLFLRFYWLPETLSEGNVVVSFITALCIGLVLAGRFRFANNSIKI